MKIIVTFVTNTRSYEASFDGMPLDKAYGATPADAIGNLVLIHGSIGDIKIFCTHRTEL